VSHRERFPGVISLLRFFAESGNYGVVDRVANSLSTEAVVQAIYDALRTVRAQSARAVKLKIKSNGESYTITCVDYGILEREDPRYRLAIKGVVEEGPSELIGKRVYCIPMPRIPSEEELESFFKAVEEEGIEVARAVAALALGFRSKGQAQAQ